TMTTVLAGRVRMGSSPTISALATVIVILTITAAIIFEITKKHNEKKANQRLAVARRAEAEELSAQK
ncbi:MAG TPA: ABC transporter permease, partial [Paenirhodobacter sp.]